MKKNRTLLGVALVIALLVLGVGYAWQTLSPTVNGTATISESTDNFVVALENPTVNGTGNTFTSNGLTGTLTVNSLKSVGDTVTATVEVVNRSDVGIKASVTDDTVTEVDTGNYFTVTTDWEATELTSNGGKKLMTITVKLDKAPISEVSGTFTIKMDATAQAE